MPEDQKIEPKPEVKADQSPVANYEAVMRELELIKAENRILKDQLNESKKVAECVLAEKKAQDEAERRELINRIIIYSGGKYTETELAGKDTATLKEKLKTIIDVREDVFVGISAYYDEQQRRFKPQLTVGYWDTASKTWKGGIDTA